MHLVDDLVRHFRHEVVRQVCPVGGHGIGTGDGTQGYGVLGVHRLQVGTSVLA